MSVSTNGPLFGASYTDEIYVPDQLICGDFPRISDNVNLAGGSAILMRGTVLGMITSSGLYIAAASAATDGSQNPVCVLADNVDVTAGEVMGAGVYLTGEFDTNWMFFGTGYTAAALKPLLRPLGIFLKLNGLSAVPV